MILTSFDFNRNRLDVGEANSLLTRDPPSSTLHDIAVQFVSAIVFAPTGLLRNEVLVT